MTTRYPVFIPSRGRARSTSTARILSAAGIPFTLVVEPHEVASYVAAWGVDRVEALPESGRGIAYSRTHIKHLAEISGTARHWQLDDDVLRFCRRDPIVPVTPGDALGWVEDLCDAYTNVGVASHSALQWPSEEPVLVNRYTYGTILVKNGTPFYWRVNAAEDGDFTLQNLAAGYATLVVKGVRAATAPNAAGAKGGNDTLYADGLLRRFVPFAELWPGVVTLDVKGQKRIRWSAFDGTRLIPSGLGNPSAGASGLIVKETE